MSRYRIVRFFSTSGVKLKNVVPSNLKGKSTSSQLWLQRQLTDPYVEKAKMMNLRSAFKLIEIDDKFGILKPGDNVVDCGAAPGSWSQVAVERVNANLSEHSKSRGTVIAIDKQFIHPIDGVTVLGNSDFTSQQVQSKLVSLLADRKVDVVMSDMAPGATGIRSIDTDKMLDLCYMALRFALNVSKVDGTFLVKLWQCGDSKDFERELRKFYGHVRLVKPQASRNDSAEIFFLCRNFKGLKK